MFSRTTMASSMSSPMASDSAIRVITLSVIPMKFITVKDEITEIGSVSPVITVERQELRKQKTMKMVRMPPRIIVSSTSRTESRIMIEASRTSSMDVPGGSSGCRRRDLPLDRVDHLDGVGPGLLRDVERHGGHAVHERQRPLLLDAVGHGRHLAQRNRPPRPAGHHHGPELPDVVRLSRDPQGEFRPAPRQPPQRGVDVLRRQPRDHLVHRHPERLEADGVDVDVHLALRGAHEVDLADPRDVLEPPLDLLLHQRGQLFPVEPLRPHREGDDRHRRRSRASG